MRRFFDPCCRYREQLSLLVSEALRGREGAGLEDHLSACADCRRYRNEIRAVTGSLLRWEESVARLQPSEAALTRWDRDFAKALEPSRVPIALDRRVLNWFIDIIWPARRIWAGLAAVWVILFVVNFSQRSPVHASVAKMASPSPELVRAFFEGGGFLDQPINPAEKNAEPPRPPAPRSEQRSGPVSSQPI
jgi:hypothetical protein